VFCSNFLLEEIILFSSQMCKHFLTFPPSSEEGTVTNYTVPPGPRFRGWVERLGTMLNVSYIQAVITGGPGSEQDSKAKCKDTF